MMEPQFCILLNSIAFVVLFLIEMYRRRRFTVYLSILLLYMIVAIGSNFAYPIMKAQNRYIFYSGDVTLLPFVFFITALLVFIFPFKKLSAPNGLQMTGISDKKLFYFASAFIFIAALETYEMFYRVVAIVREGNWLEVRTQLYEGENEPVYRNLIERILFNLKFYFELPSILVFFLLLVRNKVDKRILILMGIAIALPKLFGSIITASRGLLVNFCFQILFCYTYFYNQIRKNYRTVLNYSIIIVLAIFVIYSISVTESRFVDDANDSYFTYFGESFINFNIGPISTRKYMWGEYTLKWFYSLLGLETHPIRYFTGIYWGPIFTTFLGSLYLDFSLVGVYVFGFAINRLINYHVSLKNIRMCNLFMIFFIYDQIVHGVFVTSTKIGILTTGAVIVYYMLKKYF